MQPPLKKATRIDVLGEAGAVRSTKIHALTYADGLPVKIAITPGQTRDIEAVAERLTDIRNGQMVLACRAYDADWLWAMVAGGGGSANIPPKHIRRDPACFSPWLYRQPRAQTQSSA